MSFHIDQRLLDNSFILGDWPLSRVLLKDNALYPWLVLIPRVENVTEIYQLPQESRYLLMDEISQLSTIVKTYFKPDKINTGSLGNVVPQLHVHVLGRFIDDKQWPFSVWQKEVGHEPYSKEAKVSLVQQLRDALVDADGLIQKCHQP